VGPLFETVAEAKTSQSVEEAKSKKGGKNAREERQNPVKSVKDVWNKAKV